MCCENECEIFTWEKGQKGSQREYWELCAMKNHIKPPKNFFLAYCNNQTDLVVPKNKEVLF